mgnify:CR=1 FL=1
MGFFRAWLEDRRDGVAWYEDPKRVRAHRKRRARRQARLGTRAGLHQRVPAALSRAQRSVKRASALLSPRNAALAGAKLFEHKAIIGHRKAPRSRIR